MDDEREELKRLRRQYRILTNDKHALKAADTLRSDGRRKALQTLRNQLSGLQMSLNATKKKTKDDQKMCNQVNRILKEHACYVASMRSQRENIVEIDKQIKNLEREIRKLRANEQIRHPPEDGAERRGDMQRMRYENRLDALVRDYCSILQANRKLREDVQSMLKNRHLFNERFHIQISALQTSKRHLLAIMDSSKMVYLQREEFLEKLQALRMKSKAMECNHVEEMIETRRRLNAQTQLGEFLQGKRAHRVLADLERLESSRQMAQVAHGQNELEKCRRTIDVIREFVGEDDFARIVNVYMRREDENFALFNYVNILNGEIDALIDDTEQLHMKIDGFQMSNVQAKAQEDAGDLQDKLMMARREAAESSQQLKRSEDEMKAIVLELERMFNLLQCEGEPIVSLIGDNNCSITSQNVLAHLEIFEGKLGSLLM